MIAASTPPSPGAACTSVAALGQRAADRLAQFPSFLRANGFGVGGNDPVEVLRAAQQVGILDADVLRWSLKALLCGRGDEWRRFDPLFDAWFLPANTWQQPQRRETEGRAPAAGSEPATDDGDATTDDDRTHSRRSASREEVLSSADFRTLTEREHLLDIEALMRHLARELRPIRLRRDTWSASGRRLDLPTTIRRSIGSGGTPFELAWRDRRRVQPRLVLLIDVSRSMVLYSFFYLRLARALAGELNDVHSYIFHTRVTAVTRALQDPDPWRAQERLHLLAQGWAGGTRIGESLEQFNRDHAPDVVHSRTAIVILSDGYDTGEPTRLSAALAHLRGRARRIVWLNPLVGQSGYAPVSQGMQAALPHLDLLAPAADLDSLRAVLPELIEALT